MSGLDIMKAQREKGRRPQVGNQMPPPMHPARTTPVDLAAAETDSAAPEAEAAISAKVAEPSTLATPQVETTAETRASKTKRSPALRRNEKSATDQMVGSELYPTTAYLELDEDKYIRRALEAGRYGKPKVTSASAVIRYAVRRLAQQMTPEQVVAAIREAAPETSNQGRIRL